MSHTGHPEFVINVYSLLKDAERFSLQGAKMKWTVTDTIACPSTGTFFSQIVSEGKLQLILWYSSEYVINRNDVLTTGVQTIYRNGKRFRMDVLKVMPGNEEMWHQLKINIDCPGSQELVSKECLRMTACAFDVCPWGKKQR